MKTLVLAAIRCSLMFLIPTVTYGTSAQWDLDPISGDWNTAANWTPNDVPNGPGDIATFGLSNTTDVSISADTEVNSIIFTSEATSPYTITATSGLTLTISGAGITNTSGIPQPQNFVAEPEGVLIFTNSATAGNNVTITNNGADISGGFGGTTQFFDNSTAGNATITNERGGLGHGTQFFDSSTAGNATITNDGPNTLGNLKQLSGTQFFDSSTAGNATITNNGGDGVRSGGITQFFDRSTAGNVTIINGTGSGGGTDFFDSSTAGNATLIVNGGSGGGNGGFIRFFDSSTGDTARVEVFGNGELNISGHGAPGVTVGSIEGDGNVFLVGDATLATFPGHDTPRFATSAAVSFAAIDLFITQVSWVRLR